MRKLGRQLSKDRQALLSGGQKTPLGAAKCILSDELVVLKNKDSRASQLAAKIYALTTLSNNILDEMVNPGGL